MRQDYAKYLIEKTKADYNLIAEQFSSTRITVPEDATIPLQYTKTGDRVLDLGCGNGALWKILKDKGIKYIGIDNSKDLIERARKQYPGVEFQTAEALKIPFPDNSFDKIYCIGVIHHIPSEKIRIDFLKEAKRVLKPGGKIILRVWDFWRRKKGMALLLKHTLLKAAGKTQIDFKDIFYPWKDGRGKTIIERYFHCFTKREINKLFKRSGFKIEKSWIAGKGKLSNIYIVAEK